jgi:predicted metal-dependent hydrolase
MPVLTIGSTDIPYSVRLSRTATAKRIVVTPSGVEVIAPEGTDSDGVRAYLHQKRRWVFDAVREIEAKHRRLLTQQYASGAKLQYRGRWLMLDVTSAPVDSVHVSCRNKFHIAVPEALDGVERLESVQRAVDVWLHERALRDLLRFGRRYERVLGQKPASYWLSDAKARWGSLTSKGTVCVHWRLVQAPVAAMEYVVAHELAHLAHRNHSPQFWATLTTLMPDWEDRKRLLERWEQDHRAV